jgi:hypothetical protein
MEFLISNDAVLDPIDTGLFERYERDASSQLEEKSSATVTTLSIEEASPDVQQALAAVVRWADETFPTGSLVQHEVPLGATRVSRTAESSSRQQLELDRSLDDVDPTSESPERLPYEHDLARAGGARTAAGTVKADFIVLADDSVYIGEIKSASERIESQRDAYHALGQVLDYAIRFTEDFPTLAREADVYPIIATPDPGVDTHILAPSFEAHGVGLLETTGGTWVIEPNGNFQPPYRDFLQD